MQSFESAVVMSSRLLYAAKSHVLWAVGCSVASNSGCWAAASGTTLTNAATAIIRSTAMKKSMRTGRSRRYPFIRPIPRGVLRASDTAF